MSEPEWLSTARERTPTAPATLADDGRFVEFVFESGNPIAAGSRTSIFAEEADEAVRVVVDEPVETGPTAYRYRDRPEEAVAGNWIGAIARGSPPSTLSPEPFDRT